MKNLEHDVENEKEERKRDLVDHGHYKKKIDVVLFAAKERVKYAVPIAVEEYKAPNNFRSKVAEGAISAHYIGFKECLGKVKESFPMIDVSRIISRLKETVDGEHKGGKATSSKAATPLDIVIAETSITSIVEAPIPDQAQVGVHSEAIADVPSLASYPDFKEDLIEDQSSQKPIWKACSFYGKIIYFEDGKKIPKATIIAYRIRAIVENMGMFFWAYKMGFNQCIAKKKEFFPNINPPFLTLTDIDAEELCH
ncbi:hypothetical protein COCNU_05G006310 [Cocos nucifera]|uniref:Uncharacterized protein n=1 Tax=Cocos nucifera TaxID=13894 RepID=A0A8K0N1F0_COCNU|nr:hypothetical protein COCNU_05G006310 [Cocos nucifera]